MSDYFVFRNKYFLEESALNRNENEVEIIGKIQDIILEILQYALSSCDIRYCSPRDLVRAVTIQTKTGVQYIKKIYNHLVESITKHSSHV